MAGEIENQQRPVLRSQISQAGIMGDQMRVGRHKGGVDGANVSMAFVMQEAKFFQ